jgi:hypothetical protein
MVSAMLKAVLISLATLVSFDAVAWDSAVRAALMREARSAVVQIESLSWRWG